MAVECMRICPHFSCNETNAAGPGIFCPIFNGAQQRFSNPVPFILVRNSNSQNIFHMGRIYDIIISGMDIPNHNILDNSNKQFIMTAH